MGDADRAFIGKVKLIEAVSKTTVLFKIDRLRSPEEISDKFM